MIALIDYGSGNLHSVNKALEHSGADVELVSQPGRLAEASAILLPGVGAFGDCARNLHDRGLWEPIQGWLGEGKPFLGICVGYQLLFEGGEESPGEAGFGFFKGQVQRFRSTGVKVPQIGWNALELTQPSHPLWAGLPSKPFVYFVHSYYPAPLEQGVTTATSEYGERFAAAAARGEVAGVQFHPEKSQDAGLTILKNFVSRYA